MKFTLSWLKEHLETALPLEEIVRRLTMLGLEVEQVTDPAARLAPFVVALVETAEQHPNADKLKVCRVNTGSKTVQVVTGAPNVRAGMKSIFADIGTTIPANGLVLKPSKLRGVDSNGMLCSYRELELGEDHTGIIDLPGDPPVGAPAASVLGADDPVIEIKLTPNRGDCLGVRGIARDLAAEGAGRLKPENAAAVPGSFPSPIAWKRALPAEAGDACPIVVGRYFRNVRNGPSPDWLQKRLKAIGLRPISALVDITNYVTFDLGRPLHVFDADRLDGDLTMRLARPGEKVLALDGREYALDETMAVIADSRAVHGIGGIMGGEESGCTEATTNVFLEVAYFSPVRTAATGRKLGINSDARYRFERGVDPESCRWGAEVAARLILELCGGEASAPVQAGDMPAWQRSYTLRPDRVRGLAGIDVPAERATAILRALGFTVSGEGPWQVAVPSWRSDIVGEADLVEEIVRVHGYDHLPAVPLPRQLATTRPVRTPAQRRGVHVRRALAGRGLSEAVTNSFMARAHAELFGGSDPALVLVNPIAADLDAMRPSILPNLLQAGARNADRGWRDLGLFEVGPQYRDPTPDGQALVAAGVRLGLARARHWSEPPRPVDAFDAKADALAGLAAAGAPVDSLQIAAEAPSWYHPGRAGTLRLGTKPLAWFGEVHPGVAEKLGLRGAAVAFEILLDNLPPPKQRPSRTRPPLKLSPLQPVERDFAFLVADTVSADAVARAARAADKALIAGVNVFDVYAGKGVAPGHKSIAISVTLQPFERTLTDEEIEAIGARIVAQVTKATGATLRTQ